MLLKHAIVPKVVKGESYSGSMTVSKTVHGGSNPSSPVDHGIAENTAIP